MSYDSLPRVRFLTPPYWEGELTINEIAGVDKDEDEEADFKSKVDAVNTAYDSLTDKQKILVSPLKDQVLPENLKVITYGRPSEYKSNYYSSLGSMPKINLINLDMGFDWNQISPQFLFLWGQ